MTHTPTGRLAFYVKGRTLDEIIEAWRNITTEFVGVDRMIDDTYRIDVYFDIEGDGVDVSTPSGGPEILNSIFTARCITEIWGHES